MNLYDYIHWRGDLKFEYDPFNEIDAAIFTMISYVNWSGIVGDLKSASHFPTLEQGARLFESRRKALGDEYQPNSSYDKNALLLLSAAAVSPRFSNIRLAYFEEKIDYENSQQFAALTFFLLEHDSFHRTPRFVVTYRGTDNKWVGWKEDFETFYKEKIPAQDTAEEYLKGVLAKEKGIFSLAGHSKGGHLSIYGASKVSISDQRRIQKIYSYDGLGFNFQVLDRSTFRELESKTVNFLPEDTIVGKFFPLIGATKVVDSEGKMFDQHNPFLWKVDVKTFAPSTFSEFSLMNEKIIQTWVSQMDLEERKILLDGLFDMLGASSGTLKPDATKDTLGLWKELKQKKPTLDPHTQEIMEEKMDSLKRIVKKYVGRALKNRLPWRKRKKNL